MVFQLLQLLQKGNKNTFGEANTKYNTPRHYLSTLDLWRTGDTFGIGPHEGYTDYGENFFTKKTVFDDGSEFPYGIVFDEVMPDVATLTINYLGE